MSNTENYNSTFVERIKVKQDKEQLRLMKLKQKYDNAEITEEDISEDDARCLVKLYEKEISDINDDIQKYQNRIKHGLVELKKS